MVDEIMGKIAPGKFIKIHKLNKEVETWLLMGIRTLESSGKKLLRVRHITGFSGHIMLEDIVKIELL